MNYSMVKEKVCLITGGTGYLGHELAKQFLSNGAKEVIIYSRNEASQVAMKEKFRNKNLRFVIGDIRDERAIIEACKDVDIVIHTAALKHITVCELQPEEAVKTNIIGTINVINACIANKVRIFVNISTDKVVNPTCFYGRSKAISEGLTVLANNRTEHTDFINVRCGNILASTGSVVPLFISQIEKNNEITITNPKMTRFFMPVDELVENILKCMRICDRGETFIFYMNSFTIKDLAGAIIDLYGKKNTKIKEIGERPGEKLHEDLISPDEFQRAYTYDRDIAMILPVVSIKDTDYIGYHKLAAKVYMQNSSDPDNLEGKSVLINLLKQAGY